MTNVVVSTEALEKTRAALREYQVDILDFAAKAKRQEESISESADFQTKKINKEVEETAEKIKQLEAEIKRLEAEINQMTQERISAEQRFKAAQAELARKIEKAATLKRQIEELKRSDPSTLSLMITATANASTEQPGPMAQLIGELLPGNTGDYPGGPASDARDQFIHIAINAAQPAMQRMMQMSDRLGPPRPPYSFPGRDGEPVFIRSATEATDETSEKIRMQISQLQRQLSQVKSEIRDLEKEVSELEKRIPKLRLEIHRTETTKTNREENLREEKGRLDRRQHKQQMMKSALERLRENMNSLLTAAKSFETQAVSETEKSVGGIDRCIAAIDAYLA